MTSGETAWHSLHTDVCLFFLSAEFFKYFAYNGTKIPTPPSIFAIEWKLAYLVKAFDVNLAVKKYIWNILERMFDKDLSVERALDLFQSSALQWRIFKTKCLSKILVLTHHFTKYTKKYKYTLNYLFIKHAIKLPINAIKYKS